MTGLDGRKTWPDWPAYEFLPVQVSPSELGLCLQPYARASGTDALAAPRLETV